jgi:hypothetical protein
VDSLTLVREMKLIDDDQSVRNMMVNEQITDQCKAAYFFHRVFGLSEAHIFNPVT